MASTPAGINQNGGSGNDVLTGGAGADRLSGGSGDDILNGGAGSDVLNGGSGNDTLVYVLAQNAAAGDVYTGGSGSDTVRLELTHAEWMSASVQYQLGRYYQHLQTVSRNANTGEVSNGSASDFTFNFGAGTTLTVQMTEQLAVSVDGAMVTNLDRPQIVAATTSGSVVEDGEADADPLTQQSAGGSIQFFDLDFSDDHVVSVAAPAGAYGSLIANLTDVSYGDGQGSVAWTYTLNNAAVQFLAAGESRSEVFIVRIADANNAGNYVESPVTVTITGTNDAVTITSAAQSGAVVEDADATSSPLDALSASGTISFEDVDLIDVHTAVFAAAATNTTTLGVFALATVSEAPNTANGSVSWTYTLDNASAQSLARGESVIERYTVTVGDGHGSTASQSVAVTITGTNDAPVIDELAADEIFRVTEDGAQIVGGQLTATDVDHNAFLRWSVDGGVVTSLTADYLFKVDHFKITKNGSVIFEDAFADGAPPPAAPNFSGGTPATYSTTGVITEADGKAILDGSVAGPSLGIGTPDPFVGNFALLRTNIDPSNLAAGLKIDDDFTVESRFDLVMPDVRNAYGIQLTDRLTGGSVNPPAQPGDDLIELVVRRGTDGVVRVYLRELDVVADTVTTLGSRVLTPAEGEDQIVLRLTHEASDPGVVRASFDVYAGGSFTRSVALTQTGRIFGAETPGNSSDDENWTRAQIVSYAPAETGGTLNGIYGTLSIGEDGQWTYALNNSAANVQQLKDGETAIDTFTVRVADEFGASDTQIVSVTVTGTNDAAMISGETSGSVTEDAALVASGDLNASDVDGADDTWDAVLQPTSGIYGTYAIDSAGVWTYTLNNSNPAVQALDAGRSLSDSFVAYTVDGTPQIVTVTINGTNDGQPPTITASAPSGTLVEPGAGTSGTATCVATLSKADPDGPAVYDTTGWTSLGNGLFSKAATYGSAVLDTANDTLTYQLDGMLSVTQALQDSDVKTETFAVVVREADGPLTASTNVSFTIHGTNDAPAVVGSIAAQATQVGQPFSLTIPGGLFSDVDDANLTLAVATSSGGSLPAWLSYDSSTGVLSGTPSSTDAGLVQVAVKATDAAGASASILVPVTVIDGLAISGTDGPDSLIGTIQGDRMLGLSGNDMIDGIQGADYIDGGPGHDVIVGGPGDDVLIGGDGNDNLSDGSGNDVLQGGAGDDYLSLSFSGAGTTSLTQVADGGAGNNNFWVSNTINPNVTYQLTAGAGSDYFQVGAGGTVTLNAGDGANSINVTPTYANGSSSGNGNYQIVSGSGNDSIYVSANSFDYQQQGKTFSYSINSGGGADNVNLTNLFIYKYYNQSLNISVDTGTGNDTIYAPHTYDHNYYGFGNGALQVNAGDGDDVVHFGSVAQGFLSFGLSLGTGSDKVVVGGWTGSSMVTISDFTTGAGGDELDLNAVWNGLIGWDGSSNPFGAGFARLVQDGGDTLLQIDRDGAGSAQSYQTLIDFQNHAVADFTTASFNPPYPVDGSAPAAQTIIGTSGSDGLTGGIGNDTIYGDPIGATTGGNDSINGAPGNDTLDGGPGHDVIVGGPGDDVLIGGDGNDNLSDGSGNDVLQGGAGDDYLSLSFSGAGTTSLTQVADGGAGNNNFWVSNTINPNVTYQLTAGAGSDYFQVGAGGTVTLNAGDGANSINVTPTYANGSSSGNGNYQIVSGSGNDSIYVSANSFDYQQQGKTFSYSINSGGGADNVNLTNLFIYKYYNQSLNISVDTGTGNDTIYAPHTYDHNYYGFGNGALQVNAGDGDDVVHFGSVAQGFLSFGLSLGTGSDKVVVGGWTGSSMVTISDFTTGAGGDELDLNAVWNGLIGWDGSSNPFGAGFARLVQDGGDTLLQIDRDGAGSAQSYQTLIDFQNHAVADFTTASFNPPYPVDGSAPAAQTIIGTSGSDGLTGGIGNDTIYGDPIGATTGGNDSINGAPGNDTLDGGPGHDVIVGGPGDDVLIGGDGNDNLSDGSGNDVLQGGAGDDYLSLSFTGSGTPTLTQVADGGSGNNSFNVNNYNNPNIAYQLTAGAGSDYFYANTTGHLTVNAGDGSNTIYAQNSNSFHIVSGAQSDYIYAGGNVFDSQHQGQTLSSSISSGGGDDTVSLQNLFVYTYYNINLNVSVDAGAGNDTIYTPTPYDGFNYGFGGGSLQINAGDGNDVVHVGNSYNNAVSFSLTLGAGSDQVLFGGWPGGATLTLTDFATGTGGDKLDLNAVWNGLLGWDGSSNPFGAGFARLVQDGGDTLLQIDRDGAGSAQSYQTLIDFQNHAVADFTTASFNPPYQTNGGGIFGQTIFGTGNGATINGTIGDDVITGTPGNDVISGGNGNDLIDGGSGNDMLSGGFGADTFAFKPGAGQAVISDFSKTEGDVINLHELLQTFSGYDGANAFTGGYLHFAVSSGSTVVRVDSDGTGGASAITLATLTNALLQQTDVASYVL